MKTILIILALVQIAETVNLYCTRSNPVTALLMELRFNTVWLFYFAITMQLRINYAQGQTRGYHVIEANSEPRWYGGDFYFRYDKNQKPFREYSTYKELRAAWRKAGLV